MPKCKNPECNKDVPKNIKFCSEECLRKNMEMDIQLKEGKLTTEFKSESDIWQGQARMKRVFQIIMKIADELCPIDYETFLAHLNFRLGLTRRKLEEDYLNSLFRLGFIGHNGNTIIVIKKQEFKELPKEESQSFADYVKEQKEKEVKQ